MKKSKIIALTSIGLIGLGALCLGTETTQAKNVVSSSGKSKPIHFLRAKTSGPIYSFSGANSNLKMKKIHDLKGYSSSTWIASKKATIKVGSKNKTFYFVTTSTKSANGWIESSNLKAVNFIEKNYYINSGKLSKSDRSSKIFSVHPKSTSGSVYTFVGQKKIEDWTKSISFKTKVSDKTLYNNKVTLYVSRLAFIYNKDGAYSKYWYVTSNDNKYKGWVNTKYMAKGDVYKTSAAKTPTDYTSWKGTDVLADYVWGTQTVVNNSIPSGISSILRGKTTTTDSYNTADSIANSTSGLKASFKTLTFLPLGKTAFSFHGKSYKLTASQQALLLNGDLFVMYHDEKSNDDGLLLKVNKSVIDKAKKDKKVNLFTDLAFNKPLTRLYLQNGSIQIMKLPNLGHGGAFSQNGKDLYYIQNHVGSDNYKGRFFKINPKSLAVTKLQEFSMSIKFGSNAPTPYAIPDTLTFINENTFYLVAINGSKQYLFYKGTMNSSGKISLTLQKSKILKNTVPNSSEIQGLQYRRSNNSLYMTMNKVFMKVPLTSSGDVNSGSIKYVNLNKNWELENLFFDWNTSTPYLLRNSANEILTGSID